MDDVRPVSLTESALPVVANEGRRILDRCTLGNRLHQHEEFQRSLTIIDESVFNARRNENPISFPQELFVITCNKFPRPAGHKENLLDPLVDVWHRSDPWFQVAPGKAVDEMEDRSLLPGMFWTLLCEENSLDDIPVRQGGWALQPVSFIHTANSLCLICYGELLLTLVIRPVHSG